MALNLITTIPYCHLPNPIFVIALQLHEKLNTPAPPPLWHLCKTYWPFLLLVPGCRHPISKFQQYFSSISSYPIFDSYFKCLPRMKSLVPEFLRLKYHIYFFMESVYLNQFINYFLCHSFKVAKYYLILLCFSHSYSSNLDTKLLSGIIYYLLHQSFFTFWAGLVSKCN